eukprot:ctg_2168.g341
MLRPVLSRPAVGKDHAAAVDVQGVRDDPAGETMNVPDPTRRRGEDPATTIDDRRIMGDKHAIIAVSDGSPPRRGKIGRCWAAHGGDKVLGGPVCLSVGPESDVGKARTGVLIGSVRRGTGCAPTNDPRM